MARWSFPARSYLLTEAEGEGRCGGWSENRSVPLEDAVPFTVVIVPGTTKDTATSSAGTGKKQEKIPRVTSNRLEYRH